MKENTKQQNNKILIFLYSIKMSQRTLKFDDGEANKKKFHASQQAIALDLLNIN